MESQSVNTRWHPWRPYSGAHVKAIRTAVLLIWLLIVLATPYHYYRLLPDHIFHGVGLMGPMLNIASVRAALLSDVGMATLPWSTAFLIIVALCWPSRPLLFAILLCVSILDALTKAISAYPNHAQYAPLLVLAVVVLLHPTRRDQAVDTSKDETDRESLVKICSAVLVLPYSFIAVNRLLEGGLFLFVGDAMPTYLLYSTLTYSAYPQLLDPLALETPVVTTIVTVGFALATAVELSGPLMIVLGSRWRLTWLAAIIGFHLLSFPVMRIGFWENIVLLLVVLGWGGTRKDISVSGGPSEPAPESPGSGPR